MSGAFFATLECSYEDSEGMISDLFLSIEADIHPDSKRLNSPNTMTDAFMLSSFWCKKQKTAIT